LPTTLANFPQVSRNGTQQTPYVQLSGAITSIHLVGTASDAALEDVTNAITFTILASPTGSDADAVILQIEPWRGFTRINKFTGQPEPNPIDVGFGLDARQANAKISLRAEFAKPMIVGATLTGLP
jgi:hypothetical protein